nr:zinc finger, CCHC-type [Tanacetum cinerariifolium]
MEIGKDHHELRNQTTKDVYWSRYDLVTSGSVGNVTRYEHRLLPTNRCAGIHTYPWWSFRIIVAITLASRQHRLRNYMVGSVNCPFAELKLETANSQDQKSYMRQPRRSSKSKVASKLHVRDKRVIPTRDVSLWSSRRRCTSSMSMVYVLTTPMPEDGGDNPTVEQFRKRAKWDNDDYVCKGLILNGMSDSLFDIYQNVETSKELWDSLEAKYMAEDVSSKKFLVCNFINYKMTDSKPVLKQYNELFGILRRFTQHKINIDKSIQVSCIIDKLPPSWKDFKHTLKHLKEELTLVELGSHLHIEESPKAQDNDKPKGNNVAGPLVVYMVEHNNSFSKANGSGTKGLVDGSSNSLKSQNILINLFRRFKTYESLNDGSILHMGNESAAVVHGRGCVDLSTIRLLIAMVFIHNLIIHQMDVKTTFLNGESEYEVDLTKEFLSLRFSMKDMGETDVIVGIRINHESNGIAISQSYYIEKVLKKFNYFDCTPVSTLMDTSEKLMPNNGQAVSQLKYPRVIGFLMYAMTSIRPDIRFVVEFEFMALAVAGKEVEWLKNLLFKIPLWSKPIAPIFIRCDNAATLAKAYSQMYNGKFRHLGVRHSIIRKLITNGVVSIEFVRSQKNLANHLTKGLARDLVIKSAEGMGLKSN